MTPGAFTAGDSSEFKQVFKINGDVSRRDALLLLNLKTFLRRTAWNAQPRHTMHNACIVYGRDTACICHRENTAIIVMCNQRL